MTWEFQNHAFDKHNEYFDSRYIDFFIKYANSYVEKNFYGLI